MDSVDYCFELPPEYSMGLKMTENLKMVQVIVCDPYEDEDGETRHKFNCQVEAIEYDDDIIADNLPNAIVDEIDNCRYMTFPGSTNTVLLNKAYSVRVSGRKVQGYSLIALIQTGDKSVLQIACSRMYCVADPYEDSKLYEHMYDVLKSLWIDDDYLSLGDVSPADIQDQLEPKSEADYEYHTRDEFDDMDDDEDEFGDNDEDNFSYVTPDKTLYPHYNQIKETTANFIPGVVVNGSGTEYEFKTFGEVLRDWDPGDNREDEKTAVQTSYDLNPSGYTLAITARSMIKLFRVDKDVFRPGHDKESELQHNLMHKAYMMSGLRSFAWTLADYCHRRNTTPENVEYAILSEMVQFVADRDWLNYDGETYCKGLCSGSDLHVFFLPDAVSKKDRDKFLPPQEDVDRVNSIKEKSPSYNEILTEVHSLDALRTDLVYLHPAVTTLYEHLLEYRDSSEPLEGCEADIVYAWIALAIAAEEPFFTEDGPMQYRYDWPGDDEQEKTTSNSDPIAEKAAQEWMRTYGSYIETDPVIDFINSRFVFSGLPGDGPEKENPVVQTVIKLGGSYRMTVSGITDYLVVNPSLAGCSKVNAAIKQQENSKKIKIILLDELLRVLGEIPVHESTDASLMGDTSTQREDWSIDVDENGVLCSYRGEKTDLILPEGVQVIDDFAFSDCSTLKSVVLPSSLKKIGEGAFSECSQLTDIRIPDDCEEIADWAFDKCSALKTVVLPDSLKKIGRSAFSNCNQLTDIRIPDSCEEIPDWAFGDCSSLKSVILPGSLKKIGAYSFSGCSQLTDIRIPEGCEEIADWAFYECPALNTVELPISLKKIRKQAFFSCDNLADVYIPDSVCEIGVLAFSDSTVFHVINGSYAETYAKEHRFDIVYETDTIATSIPTEIPSVEESDDCDDQTITSVDIPEGVQSIDDRAFAGCSTLKTVILPHSLKEIGSVAFCECSRLTSIHIPDGCEKIGDYAFKDCTSLNTLLLPKFLKTIGKYAFSGCIQLADIHIPDGCEEIADYAFRNCTTLNTVVLPDSLKKIGECAFSGCSQLTDILLPEGCEKIGDSAFKDCSALHTLEIPNSLKKIGKHAFSGCIRLTDIHIPDGCEEIEDSAFMNCGALNTVVLPRSLKKIGYCAFSSKSTVFQVSKGSYAETYAKKYNLRIIYEPGSDVKEKPLQKAPSEQPLQPKKEEPPKSGWQKFKSKFFHF